MPNIFQVLMQRLTEPDARAQLFQKKLASGMLPSDATKQLYGQQGDINLPPQPHREGGLLPQLINNYRQGQQAVNRMQ